MKHLNKKLGIWIIKFLLVLLVLIDAAIVFEVTLVTIDDGWQGLRGWIQHMFSSPMVVGTLSEPLRHNAYIYFASVCSVLVVLTVGSIYALRALKRNHT